MHTALLGKRLRNDRELRTWVEGALNLKVPHVNVCPGHQAPFDYLKAAYFDAGDLVVWAPRGGGKTRLGAAATLLDLLHKPGCQVRILAGSLEQSMKMWEHLHPDVLRLAQEQLVQGARSRRLNLTNGSAAAVLTQSQRAVRGLRVQKLRCDEVELFDPQVWEAAQLTTRSRNCGGRQVRAAIEAISTLHAPHGLMARVVENAQTRGTRIIKWCILEVLERCPAERSCASCPLWEECRGIAKERCDGFLSIDDAIAMKARVSRETWKAEMLCRRPVVRDCVFPTFSREVHVRDSWSPAGSAELWLGIDFGYSNPFVCLWIQTDEQGHVHVLDEYVQPQRMIEEHLSHLRLRPWGEATKVACDPAGQARSDQTATSNVQLLRRAGYQVKTRGSAIAEGLELIRHSLRAGDGQVRLSIHPRCAQLIRALEGYRNAPGSELPIKDGTHDHLIDALRYFFINWSSGIACNVRRY